jgi:flagellar L-ring protein precursor FlgH
VVLLGALAVVAPAEAESLWQDGRHGFLFTDTRAARVGDIVTVIVTETSASNRSAETNLQKDSSTDFGITSFFGNTHLGAGEGRNRAQLKYSGQSEQKSNGNIKRSDVVTARVPARVVKVVEGGLFLIEGRRAIVVNDETQVLAFSGLVRAEDIAPDNTVLSTQVADAEVTMVGKGILAEKQRPGLLQRLFDIFRIF